MCGSPSPIQSLEVPSRYTLGPAANLAEVQALIRAARAREKLHRCAVLAASAGIIQALAAEPAYRSSEIPLLVSFRHHPVSSTGHFSVRYWPGGKRLAIACSRLFSGLRRKGSAIPR